VNIDIVLGFISGVVSTALFVFFVRPNKHCDKCGKSNVYNETVYEVVRGKHFFEQETKILKKCPDCRESTMVSTWRREIT